MRCSHGPSGNPKNVHRELKDRHKDINDNGKIEAENRKNNGIIVTVDVIVVVGGDDKDDDDGYVEINQRLQHYNYHTINNNVQITITIAKIPRTSSLSSRKHE